MSNVKQHNFHQWKSKSLYRKYIIRKKINIRIRKIEDTLRYLMEIDGLSSYTESVLLKHWRILKTEKCFFPMHPKHNFFDGFNMKKMSESEDLFNARKKDRMEYMGDRYPYFYPKGFKKEY